MLAKCFLALTGAAFLVSMALANSVPELINYQGQLTDANGSPLIGSKKLVFNIYDTPTGGNDAATAAHKIWGPQTISGVPLIDGKFNVFLGKADGSAPGDSAGPSVTTAFAGSSRYLGISVDGASELAPRQQILSTPFAVHANSADQAGISLHHSNVVPPGTVVSYFGTAAPVGWMLCHGQAIPVGADYDALRGLIGSNVPDLRGMFVRGLDAGRGIDSNRTLGTTQQDDFKSHSHDFQADGSASMYIAGSQGAPRFQTINVEPNTPGYVAQHPADKGILNSGGVETRPKNVAFEYIIKY